MIITMQIANKVNYIELFSLDFSNRSHKTPMNILESQCHWLKPTSTLV